MDAHNRKPVVTSQDRTLRLATRMMVALYLVMLLHGTAFAQAAADCTAEQTGGTMSESAYRAVELAIEDLSSDKFADAEKRLLSATDRATGYERAVIYQTLGYVYAQQEQLTRALEAFEEALANGALPREAHEDLLYNTGQLYIAAEQYERGVEVLERFLTEACKPPPAPAHMMLANAYAQIERYEPALAQVETALGKADKVEEPWLKLKLALHYELKQLAECAVTLVELITMQPDSSEYWKQLSGVLMEVEDQEDSLAVLALAERQGMLETERDLKNLAGVYLLLEIPYKAGVMFERGMENGTVELTADNYKYLSDAWIAAREWDRAEGALRQAAELGPDGELWKRLAQVLMEKEEWRGAKQALEQALRAGVPDTGETHYLLGIAAYQAGDTRGARAALQLAARDPSSMQQAQQWLDHIAANR
jgi:tetratricopeptide (TPR) repeat protein